MNGFMDRIDRRCNRFAVLVVLAILAAGCATTSGVIVNSSIDKAHYTSVYLVTHGGNGADMDANLQKEFLRHGLSVMVGADAAAPDTQLIARYVDDWK